MAVAEPFEQQNYLGVFTSDSEAEVYIVLVGWDSGGSPKNGLWYIHSSSGPRYYYNGWQAWGEGAQADLDKVITFRSDAQVCVFRSDGNVVVFR